MISPGVAPRFGHVFSRSIAEQRAVTQHHGYQLGREVMQHEAGDPGVSGRREAVMALPVSTAGGTVRPAGGEGAPGSAPARTARTVRA